MEEKSKIIILKTNLKNIFNIKKKIKDDINTNNKITYINNDSNRKKIKIRNPGVDLVRIFGMWSILIHHFFVHGFVLAKYNSKILILMHIFGFWHVNSFALVSGIVGYKTNRYSNLLYLWTCVLVYQVVIHYLYKIDKKSKNISPNFRFDFFPVIYSKYWYFTAYFGMYLFLPIINRGIACLTKKEHKIIIFSFYVIFIIWNDINKDTQVFGLYGGYSVMGLIISYIIGAYIGKYKNNYIREKKYIYIPILLTLYILSSFTCYKMRFYQMNSLNNNIIKKIIITLKKIFVMRINSIPMNLQSISIILIAMNINYNKYISKIICFFGPLTFGVYLIHEQELVKRIFMPNLFSRDSKQLKKIIVVKLVILRSIYLFFICSFIDYIRYIIFEYVLRIKKIYIFIEKKIFKLFS